MDVLDACANCGLGRARPETAALCVQACDLCISRRLGVPYVEAQWLDWLLLADKLRLESTVACCATPVAKQLLTTGSTDAKQLMAKLSQLGQPASAMLMAVLAKAIMSSGYCGTVVGRLPSSVGCRAPESLF